MKPAAGFPLVSAAPALRPQLTSLRSLMRSALVRIGGSKARYASGRCIDCPVPGGCELDRGPWRKAGGRFLSKSIRPDSRWSHDEFATNIRFTSVEKRARRTRWTSRSAAVFCFVLVAAVGTAYAETSTFANSTPALADDAPGDPVDTRNLDAALFEKLSVGLDAWVELKTDGIVQQATEKQIAAFLRHVEQNLATSREISKIVDRQFAALRDMDLAVRQIRSGRSSAVKDLTMDWIAHASENSRAPTASASAF